MTLSELYSRNAYFDPPPHPVTPGVNHGINHVLLTLTRKDGHYVEIRLSKFEAEQLGGALCSPAKAVIL
jgi:hypothetical protein